MIDVLSHGLVVTCSDEAKLLLAKLFLKIVLPKIVLPFCFAMKNPFFRK